MDEFAFKTLISASIGKKGHIFRKRKKMDRALEEKKSTSLIERQNEFCGVTISSHKTPHPTLTRRLKCASSHFPNGA